MFYPAQFEQIGERYNISFRDIPEAITCAEQRDQAPKMAEAAILSALGGYFTDRRQIQLPSQALEGEILIAIPMSVFAKVLLLNAMIEQNISNVDLAKRINIQQQEMQHILSLHHSTPIDRIELALAALGKQLAMTTA